MKKRSKTAKSKKKKLHPIYSVDTSNITVSDDMIDYDFDNDPAFKAHLERVKERLRKLPIAKEMRIY